MNRPGYLVAHPLVLVMAGLLLVNDHILKGWWPSWWTGKLSDVAWVVVAAALAATALRAAEVEERRARRVSVAAVAIVFTVLQLWAPLGDAWCGMFGGEHVADPTDLLALPAVLSVLWIRWPRRQPRWVLVVAAGACLATKGDSPGRSRPYKADCVEDCPTVRVFWDDDGLSPADADGDGRTEIGCDDVLVVEIDEPAPPDSYVFGIIGTSVHPIHRDEACLESGQRCHVVVPPRSEFPTVLNCNSYPDWGETNLDADWTVDSLTFVLMDGTHDRCFVFGHDPGAAHAPWGCRWLKPLGDRGGVFAFGAYP